MNADSSKTSASFEFQKAVSTGNFQAVTKLVKSGAVRVKANPTLIDSLSPVVFASRCGQSAIADWLMSDDAFSAAELDFLNCIRNNNLQDVINVFENNDLNTQQALWPGDEFTTPIGIAIKSGNCEMVNLLVRLGFRANSTHLSQAILCQNIQIIDALLETVVNINELNMSKQTALFSAAARGDLETIKKLVQRGIDVNYEDDDEQTAVECAITNGHEEVAKYLYPYSSLETQAYIGTLLQDSEN